MNTDSSTMVMVRKVVEKRLIFTAGQVGSCGCELVIVTSEGILKDLVFYIYKPTVIKKGNKYFCRKDDLVAQLVGVEVEQKMEIKNTYGKTYRGGLAPKVEYADAAAKARHASWRDYR